MIPALPGLHGIVDLQGRFLSISNQFANYIGYQSSEDLLGQGVTYKDVKTSAIELVDIFYDEDKFVTKSKNELKQIAYCGYQEGMRWLLGSKQPIYNESGQVQSIGMSYIDITSTELANYYSRLHHGNKSKQLVYYIKASFENKLFTRRESECLYYILRGKSASMIGKLLNISKRTVESHIENIKNKLVCDTKSQVIEQAMDLGYYYIIPDSILNQITSV